MQGGALPKLWCDRRAKHLRSAFAMCIQRRQVLRLCNCDPIVGRGSRQTLLPFAPTAPPEASGVRGSSSSDPGRCQFSDLPV
eukprot:11815620-Alexandrium_andersonii.AAC.1